MPLPQKGESRKAYLKRAIDYFVHNENRSPKEAVGRAEGFYDTYGKKKTIKSKSKRNK